MLSRSGAVASHQTNFWHSNIPWEHFEVVRDPVDEEAGTVDLAWIDAFDGTTVLDIKPYLPMSDRVMSAEYPEWLSGFPESMEEDAAFFSGQENVAMFT